MKANTIKVNGVEFKFNGFNSKSDLVLLFKLNRKGQPLPFYAKGKAIIALRKDVEKWGMQKGKTYYLFGEVTCRGENRSSEWFICHNIIEESPVKDREVIKAVKKIESGKWRGIVLFKKANELNVPFVWQAAFEKCPHYFKNMPKENVVHLNMYEKTRKQILAMSA